MSLHSNQERSSNHFETIETESEKNVITLVVS